MLLPKLSILTLLLFLQPSGSQKVNGEAPPAGEPSIIMDIYISIKESIFGVVPPALPPPKYIYSYFWDC
ncbi:hypothetical protein GDO78_004008 [Eleutherodactylus coqui]|uniref:Uncharacterized protein n=1 Tax=Eleutherodactylus coqui TaxID=57060 RepID=A0A8J6EWB7_ELECQ|nr:hypothetical protein GDO78_004008 [Eleutherodactylus coqui]